MIGSLLLVGLLLTGQAAVDDAALVADVHKLVKQLDANDKARREEAEAALLKMGPRVLDLLPPDGPDLPAEVRVRLARIRQTLQQAAADAAAAASLVTLRGRMPLSKILAALEEQTGNRIVDARPKPGGGDLAADPQLAVDFQKTPFWSALDSVLDKAQVAAYLFGPQRAIQVVARAPGQSPRLGRAVGSGPFRIEPVRVLARRDLRNSASPLLLVTLEVAWEPRLRPIGLKQRLADVKAVDENGRPLAVDDPQAQSEALPGRDAVAVEFNVPLVLPSPPPKEIAVLKGSLRAMVPGKVETFRFTDLLNKKKAEQRIAAATVVFDQIRKNGDHWEVAIRVRFDDAGRALESHRSWILANPAWLEGRDGKPIPYDSIEATGRSDNEAGFRYSFRLGQSPGEMAFVYKTPGSIITRDFRYELRGIPLP
jgi:hypothetical protein